MIRSKHCFFLGREQQRMRAAMSMHIMHRTVGLDHHRRIQLLVGLKDPLTNLYESVSFGIGYLTAHLVHRPEQRVRMMQSTVVRRYRGDTEESCPSWPEVRGSSFYYIAYEPTSHDSWDPHYIHVFFWQLTRALSRDERARNSRRRRRLATCYRDPNQVGLSDNCS
mmetsp:Transcript_37674/g.82696  ORF Transcript_37674/g.82696 Transcript_37674/m.82696 type:complete len:166 (-) Transcript_37674:445-942(-)